MSQRTAVVSGVITDAITHVPIAAAQVVLDNSSDVFRASTSPDGSWAMGELPAGTGAFTVSKPGYIEINGIVAPAQSEVTLNKDSQIVRNFTLVPAPRISGRLLDRESGKPVVGLRVVPLQEDYGMGARRFVRTASNVSVSNADGEFALTSMPPGAYIVQVTGDLAEVLPGTLRDNQPLQTSYGTSYFPDSLSVESAVPVTRRGRREAFAGYQADQTRAAAAGGIGRNDWRPG